ncbi:peptidase C39 family protein [Pedosphaera parvula]|nr:peptidase C39 family protein [Pedosphaera parvula]
MQLRTLIFGFLTLILPASFCLADAATSTDAARNRCSYMGLKDITKFTKSSGASNEVVLISPEIKAPIDWDELVVSWNVLKGVHLKMEARAICPDHITKYYTMSRWSDDTDHFPRESVNKQGDADGTVSIDTLILKKPASKVQIRITMGGGDPTAAVKYLGLSFCNSQVQPVALKPNKSAWGKVVEVPERRQNDYEGGDGWCSPTSLSMDLAYWSDKLNRPELNHTVPETAHAIFDQGLDGTGNWPFNTAYAGSYSGFRAYVTRMDDVAEVEDWIAAGIPVIVSVSSYIVSNRTIGPDNGHLIVCVGFDEKGDVVVNDPGVSVKRNLRARRVYTRENFVKAWKKSKNAVYLVYPETAQIPKDPFNHWDHSN